MSGADEKVEVPRSAPKFIVRVIALRKGKVPGAFAYLQGIRQGTLRAVNPDPEQSAVARNYHARKPLFFPALMARVPAGVDAILSPPSRFPEHAEPYRKAIAAAQPNAVDLTARLTRTGNARAGEGATVCELAKGFSYEPTGQEKDIRRLVIADDIFTTGTTAAAIVKLLHRHGLPDECEVIVACPLWLDTVKPVADQHAQ